MVVQSRETAAGRRHFMVSEGELGTPLVAATTGNEGPIYLVLFRYLLCHINIEIVFAKILK